MTAFPLMACAAAGFFTAVLLARSRRFRNAPVGLVRVTYWAGRGKCEPLRCILAAAGVTFQQTFLDAATGKQELAKLRAAGTLAYDQVPLVEIDGLNLVQGTATANYLGVRLGLLPSDPADSFTAQHIYASAQDARACLVGYPFADYPTAPTRATHERIPARDQHPRAAVPQLPTRICAACPRHQSSPPSLTAPSHRPLLSAGGSLPT